MNMLKPISRWCGMTLLLLVSCSKQPSTIPIDKMFTLLPADYTRLEFENRLVNETKFNVFKYRNYYNGGGVAIGDVNNDGLPDVYLTSNQQSNKLFINEGNFRFKNVTKQAQAGGTHEWSTGVSMVDINGDRLLDIYVCNSGNIKGDNRANELFINQGIGENGIPTFKEAAADYGIDNRGFSIHAAFFDYDRDGDLDLYVLNNAFRALSTFNIANNLRHERNRYGGDYLYRNDNGRFVDVNEKAGIYGSVIGFGLGITVSDINNDRWPDIYVANDFFERDYLYINNRDGTFKENLENMLQHTSLASMGSDIADINNDGFMDIFTTDMLPEDDYRLKTTFNFETYAFNEKKVNWGYFYQVPQNTLQLNNGYVNSKHQISFSDIGLLSGVAQTDWSWGTDIVDLDNDGFKDLFMCNGIYRDVTNQDYIVYLASEDNMRMLISGEQISFPELIEKIPSTPLSNYIYQNEKNLTFTNKTKEWGLDEPSFSNSLAYGDLDGDGDTDLIINNINQPAFVYRNETDSLTDNHFLKVKLIGDGLNTYGIGARINLHCVNKQLFVLEQMPMRTFQSSQDYTLTFGLGKNTKVDSLIVLWPDGAQSKFENILVDTMITIRQEKSYPPPQKIIEDFTPVFREITNEFPLRYTHKENEFIDFQRNPFIPHKLSTEGPKIAKGDVNGDGLEDFYIGGAKGSPGKLFVQNESGVFINTNEKLFEQNSISEDVGVSFFDVDGDGDIDLYVVSGGSEYSRQAPAFMDRLYINNGRGDFSLSKNKLPKFYASGSCVKPGDFDGDGDQDLFVGSRSIPWRYGMTPTSYLLQNDGLGNYSIVTEQYAPDLANIGLVTDAEWVDYDNDKDLDLIVVGEWMPVTIMQNNNSRLIDVTDQVGLGETNGWWNCILADDINGDGRVDLVAGNLGKNSKIQVSPTEPATIYISDFDGNGLLEQIVCYYKLGKSYPMPLRPDMVNQMPYLKDKFPTHDDYAGKQITDIFSQEQLKKAIVRKAYSFATTVFYGTNNGTFRQYPLPAEAQFSPVYAIMAKDFDDDGYKDLLLAGNFYGAKPQFGRYDASYGTLLKSIGGERFTPLSIQNSGLTLSGQVRDMVSIMWGKKQEVLIITKNNAPTQVYKIIP
jgi:hypothetical protein